MRGKLCCLTLATESYTATFVSKQSNKTSQPGVVYFLFTSIDSISFPPLGDRHSNFTGERMGGGGETERKKRKGIECQRQKSN